MEAVEIQHKCQILAGSPGAHEEPGGGGQFARDVLFWDDEED